MSVQLILMVIAAICLFLAALPIPAINGRVSLGWLGMFFWALTLIIGGR